MKNRLIGLFLGLSLVGASALAVFGQSKPISQLDSVTTLSNSDVLPIVNGGATKKISYGYLYNRIFTRLGLATVATTGNYNDLSNRPTSSLLDNQVPAWSSNSFIPSGITINGTGLINMSGLSITGPGISAPAAGELKSPVIIGLSGAIGSMQSNSLTTSVIDLSASGAISTQRFKIQNMPVSYANGIEGISESIASPTPTQHDRIPTTLAVFNALNNVGNGLSTVGGQIRLGGTMLTGNTDIIPVAGTVLRYRNIANTSDLYNFGISTFNVGSAGNTVLSTFNGGISVAAGGLGVTGNFSVTAGTTTLAGNTNISSGTFRVQSISTANALIRNNASGNAFQASALIDNATQLTYGSNFTVVNASGNTTIGGTGTLTVAALNTANGFVRTNGSGLFSTAVLGDTEVNSRLLTGYTLGTNTAIAATDNILQGFGKAQGQINALQVVSVTFASWNGLFDRNYQINATQTGNITAPNLTNAVAGATVIIPHQNSTAPQFLSDLYEAQNYNYVINQLNYIYLTYYPAINKVLVSNSVPVAVPAPSGLTYTGRYVLDVFPSTLQGDSVTATGTNIVSVAWRQATSAGGAGNTLTGVTTLKTNVAGTEQFLAFDAVNRNPQGFQTTTLATTYKQVRSLTLVGTQAGWQSSIANYLFSTITTPSNAEGFTGTYAKITPNGGQSYFTIGNTSNTLTRFEANNSYLVGLRIMTTTTDELRLNRDESGGYLNWTSITNNNVTRTNDFMVIGFSNNNSNGGRVLTTARDVYFVVTIPAGQNNSRMGFQYFNSSGANSTNIQVINVWRIN